MSWPHQETALIDAAPKLSPLVFFSVLPRNHLPEPLDGPKVGFYPWARNAIWHAIKSLNLRPGQNVLVPSYNCGAELDPIVKSGASVKFYRVDRSARIDLGHLQQIIDEQSRVLYVTHYLGFPQDLPPLLELCRKHGLHLIEDCAHALYSKYDGRYLGTFGDFGVFSMRKSLPLPDGGALLINDPALPVPSGTSRPPILRCLNETRHLMEDHVLAKSRFFTAVKRWGVDPLASVVKRVTAAGTGPFTLNAELTDIIRFYPHTSDWGISRISEFILRCIDHDQTFEKRRTNFQFLLGQLDGLRLRRIKLLYRALPDGVCPWMFPLIADDAPSLKDHLFRHRILTGLLWSDFHEQFVREDFPDADFLKTHVVVLPVHQNLDKKQLKRLVNVVFDWDRA